MSELITGDGTTWVEDFTIPDDSDPPTAAATNVADEALANRTQFLYERMLVVDTVSVTTSGSHVAPDGAQFALLEGCGGGGGGGAGANNPNDPGSHSAGGGGGAGAILSTRLVEVTGGETYAVVIGAGGAAGIHDAEDDDIPFPGGVGGDTTFSAPGPTVLATFRGAGGGEIGYGANPDKQAYGPPGMPVRFASDANGSGAPLLSETEEKNLFLAPTCPSMGCAGYSSNNNRLNPRAASSPQGYIGGAAGDVDASEDSGYDGGGAGGGGGAGPFGNGGDGGDGGAPNAAGDGGAGTNGTAGAVNTGAGGGGGGGCGSGSDPGGLGGDGGTGGSGRLKIVWLTRGTP